MQLTVIVVELQHLVAQIIRTFHVVIVDLSVTVMCSYLLKIVVIIVVVAISPLVVKIDTAKEDL